jgi:hypothetical protein
MTSKQRLGTRRQLVAYLNAEGYPYSLSTLNKLCSDAIGGGPQPFAWQGRRPLYDIDAGIEWAKARLSTKRPPPRGTTNPAAPAQLDLEEAIARLDGINADPATPSSKDKAAA